MATRRGTGASLRATESVEQGIVEAGRDSLAVVTGEGWLMKKSSGLFPRWQRRYFRVGGIFLRYYYGDDGASGAAFALDLTEKDLEVVIDCTSALDFDLRRRTANGSTVIVSLRAESEQELAPGPGPWPADFYDSCFE